ncbi:histone deacetylase [Candidatus Omnitrophota bacterium]
MKQTENTFSEIKVIYSPKYHVNIGTHIFPTHKYHLLYDRLIRESVFDEKDFIYPKPAAKEDILLVHTQDYVDKLFEGRLCSSDIMRLELPYSKELVEVSRICAEGTIRSVRHALKGGISVHIGGGFHHAFSDHGEGFCVFNDIAIGIRRAAKDGLLNRALVIDCDLHQGNGTASIFSNDKSVFTFSMHQENNYPFNKPPSDLDIGLDDGACDDEYIERLSESLPMVIERFKPDILIYVAGADTYIDDQLGGLSLTIGGMERRDEFIFKQSKHFNIPTTALLAGGYALDSDDIVTIHYNMIKRAKEILE